MIPMMVPMILTTEIVVCVGLYSISDLTANVFILYILVYVVSLDLKRV